MVKFATWNKLFKFAMGEAVRVSGLVDLVGVTATVAIRNIQELSPGHLSVRYMLFVETQNPTNHTINSQEFWVAEHSLTHDGSRDIKGA